MNQQIRMQHSSIYTTDRRKGERRSGYDDRRIFNRGISAVFNKRSFSQKLSDRRRTLRERRSPQSDRRASRDRETA